MIGEPQPYRVAIVVDRSYGERLRELSRRCHVWACKTPDNLDVARQLWAEKSGDYSLEAGVTVFNVSAEATPEEMCRNILHTVDLHHGEYSHDPRWSEIEVVGAAFTPALRAALEEYGVDEFEERPDGFLAIRPVERSNPLPLVEDLLRPLISLSPWQVVAGGSAGSFFALDFGRKVPVPRYREDRDPRIPFHGEWYLFVECCWRLDEASPAFDPVTSWQESNKEDGPMLRGLRSLISDPIRSLTVTPPAGDLAVTFESGRRLIAFCDQTWRGGWGDEEYGGDTNWSLYTPDRKVLCVGPGYRWVYTNGDFPGELSPDDPLWQSTFELNVRIP